MHWEKAHDLWLMAVAAEGCSPYTIKAYREHLAPFTKWLKSVALTEVEEVTPFHVRRFLSEYAPDHSPHTVLSIYNTIRMWFRFLVGEGCLSESPVLNLKPPKVSDVQKDVYSLGELRSILKYLEKAKTPLELRNYAVVSILADTGARASEVLALTIDDLQDDCLLLRQTKGRRPRMIPLGSKAQKTLWTYIQRGRPRLKPKDKNVFITLDGRPMTRNALRCMLNRVGQALGFPVSAHRFRHTWTTMMLRKGVDLETLRRMGGWQDYTMLKTYAHLSIENLREAQQRYSLVDGLR